MAADYRPPITAGTQAAINAEASARASADTALAGTVTAEAVARANADSAEATARANAITAAITGLALSSDLSAETTARIAADTTLTTAVGLKASSAALASETSSRTSADTALDGRLSTVESNRLDPVTWASGPATAGKTNNVDATAGAKTVPLPTGVAAGIPIAVQKTDASTNGISMTGTIRGVAASTLPIEGHRHETQVLVSEGSNSWRPISDHKTWASIRAEILALGAGGAKAVDKPGCYIPVGSFPNLGPALAAHASTLIEIPYFGDSTGYGSGSTLGGVVRKMRDLALAAGITDGGRGMAAKGETALSSGENLATVLSQSGFATSTNSDDFLGGDSLASAVAGDTVTYQGKGTAARISHTIWAGNTGRYSYSVDGGAAVIVDSSGPQPSGTAISVGGVYIGPLTEGTHTIAITNLGNAPIGPPTNINSLGETGTGGTLPIGSYDYVATGATASGETLPCGSSTAAITVLGRKMQLNVDPRNINGFAEITTIKVYRRVAGVGSYGLVGSVPIVSGNAFTVFLDDGGTAPGAAPPSVGTVVSGTTKQARVAVEFVRSAGIVLHKQAISGISMASYFNYLNSAGGTRCNSPAQKALGLTVGLSGSKNGFDWGMSIAAKPQARNVKAAILALGINDQQGSANEAGFAAVLPYVIEGAALFVRMVRAAGGDPVFVIPHLEYALHAELYSGRMEQALGALARAMGVPFVNYNIALGPVARNAGSTNVHQDQPGYDIEGQFMWDNVFAPLIAGAIT